MVLTEAARGQRVGIFGGNTIKHSLYIDKHGMSSPLYFSLGPSVMAISIYI
jgi:hypothetical protein